MKKKIILPFCLLISLQGSANARSCFSFLGKHCKRSSFDQGEERQREDNVKRKEDVKRTERLHLLNQKNLVHIKNDFKKINDQIENIENKLNEKQYRDAYRLSSSLLKNAKQKLGYENNFKSYRFPISIQVSSSEEVRPSDLNLPFGKLKTASKDRIIDILNNHQGGLFLDIVKLYKRLSVLNLTARYGMEKNKKHPHQKVFKVIRDQLIAVYSQVIKVKNINTRQDNMTYVLFDTDVYDELTLLDFQINIMDAADMMPEVKLDEATLQAKSIERQKQLRKVNTKECLDNFNYKERRYTSGRITHNSDGSASINSPRIKGNVVDKASDGLCRAFGYRKLLTANRAWDQDYRTGSLVDSLGNFAGFRRTTTSSYIRNIICTN